MNVYRVIVTILGAFSVLCAMGENDNEKKKVEYIAGIVLLFFSLIVNA